MIDINEIKDILPHRYPFLLVDRVLEVEPNQRLLAYKNVTSNEEFFNGHFPGNPIMPGVLIIEALAQAAGILAIKSDVQGESFIFLSIDKAKFRKPVVPGDRLMLEVKMNQTRGTVSKFTAAALVDDKVVTEADFTAMVTDRKI